MARTHLSIVTPTASRFEGDVDWVWAPGAAGDLAALAMHAPLLTSLRTGVVKAHVPGDGAVEAESATAAVGVRREFAVDGGFMEVLPDRVIVLTDAAVSRDEVDLEATRAELKRAEEALAQKRGIDDGKERHAVAWAQAKLEVTHRPV